jgi:hypothetical protein
MTDEIIARIVREIRALLAVLAHAADQRGMLGLQDAAARFEAELLNALHQPDDGI